MENVIELVGNGLFDGVEHVGFLLDAFLHVEDRVT